ncbi:hypothetical protein LJC59_09730 [Desulfovibrio sp. OttesenSCG-928-A18]|nr:hypothetical protein [Desulfovibrio sp. OttesenSCG-928-A18]
MQEETERFVTSILYRHTKVERINRHSELIQYIITSISGLTYRRFRQAKVERLSIEYTARSKEFSELGFDTIAEFCEYCREQDNFDSAIAITELLDLSEDKNFLLQMAISASFSAGISDDDEERLSSFNSFHRESKLIKCLFALNDERFNITEELKYIQMMPRVPGEEIENIADYMCKKDETLTATFLIELWNSLNTVEKIDVLGVSIFESFCESIYEDIKHSSLKVDVSDFVPEIEKCLNCMPRDSGEWVIIYPEVGDLRELIIEELENKDSDIPWYNYDLTLASGAKCGSCGSPVEMYETVYSDFPDRKRD